MKRTVDKMKDAAKHIVNTTKANAIRVKTTGKAIENATKDKKQQRQMNIFHLPRQK